MLDLANVYLFLVNCHESTPSWWSNIIAKFPFMRVKTKGEERDIAR